ncbi:hypothetical protein LCGC14_2255360 [marine sediment metagenome]|uniref:Uncharacterized protein n=1 Tax=marine sediment metagenome TaxID=412755 RepID=A0A0F9DNS5_9ZZZZ
MDQEDRDRLIKIEVDVSWLRSMFETHVSEHFKIKILAWGAALAAMTALVGLLF